MICPTCKEAGEKSTVYPGMSTSTCLFCQPFYDEDGKYHDHDRNIVSTSYSCSNGHNWGVSTPRTCWCGWKAGE